MVKKNSVWFISIFLMIMIGLFVLGYSRNFQDKYFMNQDIVPGHDFIQESEIKASIGLFKNLVNDGNNGTVWQSLKKKDAWLEMDLGTVRNFNTAVIREAGLNIQKFKIEISQDKKQWETVYSQDKIEMYRLATFDTVSARYVRLFIEESDRWPAIKSFELYKSEKLTREKPFRVTAYAIMSHLYDKLQDDSLDQDALEELFGSGYFDVISDVFLIFDVHWDENGIISYSEGKEKYSNTLKKFKQMLAGRDVNVFVTILNPHDNAKVMKSITENKETLLNNMIDFANEHELDGIDLDWEFPFSQEEFDAYGIFLQELKQRLVTEVKPEAQLSLALATWALRYDQKTIDVIDQVQVMGYDILDQDGQHSSFYSSGVQAPQYILDQGFSREQINLGIPYYGTYMEGRMEQYLYNGLDESIRDEWTNMYSVTDTGYITKVAGDVYYNSPAMVKDKTAYALYQELGGVMIFRLYCDIPFNEEFSLTRSIQEILEERLKNY